MARACVAYNDIAANVLTALRPLMSGTPATEGVLVHGRVISPRSHDALFTCDQTA